MGGFDAELKRAVWLRDGGHCMWCGEGVWDGDVHHRRARGMGGRDSRVSWINSAHALVLLSRSCHDMLEAEPELARAAGYRLDAGDAPDNVLVWRYDKLWVRLWAGPDGDGMFVDPVTGILGPAARVPPPTWESLRA